MSETPRTDNFIADNDIFCDSKELLLFTNFAARLETELAEARAEIERKDKLIEQIRGGAASVDENAKRSASRSHYNNRSRTGSGRKGGVSYAG